MSIADYVRDDSVEVVAGGDGWLHWRERGSERQRFDIFANERHISVPGVGLFPKAAAALDIYDAFERTAGDDSRFAGPLRHMFDYLRLSHDE